MAAASNPPNEAYPHRDLTQRIIAACFRGQITLGYGFRESVYRRALAVELQFQNIEVKQEVPYEVTYRGVVVGKYNADLVVESAVLVEVKTGLLLDPVAVPQALNYLSASGFSVALVVHFGPRVTVKRVVLTSEGHSVVEQSNTR